MHHGWQFICTILVTAYYTYGKITCHDPRCISTLKTSRRGMYSGSLLASTSLTCLCPGHYITSSKVSLSNAMCDVLDQEKFIPLEKWKYSCNNQLPKPYPKRLLRRQTSSPLTIYKEAPTMDKHFLKIEFVYKNDLELRSILQRSFCPDVCQYAVMMQRNLWTKLIILSSTAFEGQWGIQCTKYKVDIKIFNKCTRQCKSSLS